jgi:hypothetical protein
VFNLKNLPVVTPPWQEGVNPSLHPTPHAFGVGTLRPLQPYHEPPCRGTAQTAAPPPVGVVPIAPPLGLSIKFFQITSEDVQLRELRGLIHRFCILVRVKRISSSRFTVNERI